MWHEGTEPRIVLIVDVWHPDMDDAARERSIAAEPLLLDRYRYRKQTFAPDDWF